MPTGQCLCGEIKISFTGEPTYTALCHCLDDRKMSNTQVWQIPSSKFSVTAGEPKVWTKVSDHDHEINTHFCANCGTALFRTAGAKSVEGMVGLRAGVLDDPTLLDVPPKIEVYVERRPKWLPQIEGAVQLNAKYEVVGGEVPPEYADKQQTSG